MADVERLSLLHKVATLYYEEGLKKYDIAFKIEQSPTQVGLLLREAVREGLVNISVNMPFFTVLQEQLRHKFELAEAIVVPSDKDITILLQNLSQATAEYFEKYVSDGAKVAVGGGHLTYRMIDRLTDKKREIDIYPTAIIGRGPDVAHIDPIVLVTLLWAKSGQQHRRAHYVTLTPPVENSTTNEVAEHYKALLKDNEKLATLMRRIETVDYVFCSIGSLDSNQDYVTAVNKTSQNLLDEMKLNKEALRNAGAIGDIAYSYFDADGKTKKDWSIFPSIGINNLQKLSKSTNKRVVVTVGGYKIDSLRAVLKGGLCNTIITDAEAAKRVLKD